MFFVGCYIDFGTLSDRYVFIPLGITSADLRPFLQACQMVSLTVGVWPGLKDVQYRGQLPKGDLAPIARLLSHYR